jgi:hypothetical protein
MVLSGDMAPYINGELRLKNQLTLTSLEMICCNVWAQNLPNLNELAGSDRLQGLLIEDLF